MNSVLSVFKTNSNPTDLEIFKAIPNTSCTALKNHFLIELITNPSDIITGFLFDKSGKFVDFVQRTLRESENVHALMEPDGNICWTSKLGWLSLELKNKWIKYKTGMILSGKDQNYHINDLNRMNK